MVTRADIAGPLARLAPLLGRDCPSDTEVPFEDVAADDPDRSGVACLYALGVTVGTSATTYAPGDNLTRAQAATMLARIWQASGRECPADARIPFEDVADDSVHRDSIACLYALGVTVGTSATTNPTMPHQGRSRHTPEHTGGGQLVVAAMKVVDDSGNGGRPPRARRGRW